ncbi:MAG: hypothetical protein ACRDOU_06130 [Streptosporangiaceae bacterium]
MKRGRLSLAIGAVTLGLALGLGLGAVTSAAHAQARTVTQASQFYSERIVVLNCLGRAQVRPSSFILACADANDYLTKLSWKSWGPHLASAVGTQEENDCIPYCAAGHFHAYPVDVIFWGRRAVIGSPGTERYANVTMLYPRKRPPIYNGHKYVEGPQTVTISLWGPPAYG